MSGNSFPVPYQGDELDLRVIDQLAYLKAKGKQCLVVGFLIGEEVGVYSLTNLPVGGWAGCAAEWFHAKRHEFCAKVNQPDKPIDVLWKGYKLNMLDEALFRKTIELSLG